jgi:hypothetical protein
MGCPARTSDGVRAWMDTTSAAFPARPGDSQRAARGAYHKDGWFRTGTRFDSRRTENIDVSEAERGGVDWIHVRVARPAARSGVLPAVASARTSATSRTTGCDGCGLRVSPDQAQRRMPTKGEGDGTKQHLRIWTFSRVSRLSRQPCS